MDDCIISPTGKTKAGYGQIRIGAHVFLHHRLVWIRYKGSIPKDLFVCHKCDNPGCINIEHLFLGTQADNMKDMKEKGRAGKVFGEKNGKTTLTEEAVKDIYDMKEEGYTPKEIAGEFNISRRSVYGILNGTRWSNLYKESH